ncbi:hypothetical protein PUN28_009281 [Cardiocondyla obscurior]|uniref:Uncharacterized protein n=1 Tax=Cardiocondyla obscurior TaxID=286306 RepID=A0AAW2FUR9_9HYME
MTVLSQPDTKFAFLRAPRRDRYRWNRVRQRDKERGKEKRRENGRATRTLLSHNSAARREDRSLERLLRLVHSPPSRATKKAQPRAPTSRHTPTYSPFSPLEFCFSGPPRDTGHTHRPG